MTEIPLLMGTAGSLFGVLSPHEPPRDPGILILNAGLLPHVGPFRLHVDLARFLSSRDFTVLRLDQSGRGESPPRPGMSYAESILQDYDDALATLGRHGITRTVLIGLCSGADDALPIARARSTVAGVVMLDGYAPAGLGHTLRYYPPRLASPAAWIRFIAGKLERRGATEGADGEPLPPAINLRNWRPEAEMLEMMRSILADQKRMLAVFTGGVQDYYNHAGQLSSRLQQFAKSGVLREVYYPDAEHAYPVVRHREWLVDQISRWLEESFRAG